MQNRAVNELTLEEAREELARLAYVLSRADIDYHQNDNPNLSDSDYDALRIRNHEIEVRFPEIKRGDSPSEKVGGPLAEGFAKIVHSERMLSLANAFDEADVKEFDGLARHFFPRLDANFRTLDRRLGVATHLDVNVPPREVVDNDNIMTLV